MMIVGNYEPFLGRVDLGRVALVPEDIVRRVAGNVRPARRRRSPGRTMPYLWRSVATIGDNVMMRCHG